MMVKKHPLISRFLGSLIIVSISLIGCSRKVEERTAEFIDYSAPNALRVDLNSTDGVIEVQNENGPMYDGQVIRIERDLVIGVEMEGPEWQLFSGYPFLLVAPDGEMIIGDSRTNEFFIVDPKGELVRRFGGKGGGPGEFRSIRNVLWVDHGNEFWVCDSELMRVSRYSASGDLLGTINVSTIGFQRHYFTSAGDGCLIAMGLQSSVVDQISLSSFAVIDTSFQVVLDFGLLPYQEFLVADRTPKSTYSYGMHTHLYAFPGGELVLSKPREGRVMIVSPSGEIKTVISGVGERRQVNEDEKRWFRRTRAVGPRAVKNADQYLSPFLPPFGHIVTDEYYRLWVYGYRTNREIRDSLLEPVVYLYSSDGDYIGRQQIPVQFRVIWKNYGYRCTGIGEDEFPSVERWQIIPLVKAANGGDN